jgi:hypothetical protein
MNAVWRFLQAKFDQRPRVVLGSAGPFIAGRDLGWFKFSLTLEELTGHHQYVVGRSGSGKSFYLLWYMYQLIVHDQAVFLIDPHSDLANALLELLATLPTGPDQQPWLSDPDNARRVIYFEPGRTDRQIPMNMLTSPNRPYTIAQNVIEAFKRTWPETLSAAPQFENIVLHSLLLLIEHRLSLCELPPLLMDQDFRQRLLETSQQPEIVNFFKQRFDRWGREQATRLESTLNKATALLLNPNLKHILGADINKLDLRSIMDQQQILIANLGTADHETTRLIGSLLTVNLEQSALSRANIPEHERRPFFAIIDEFASFVSQEGTAQALAEMLSQVRKYYVNLALIHQGVHQLEHSNRLVGALDQAQLKCVFASGTRTGQMIAAEIFNPEPERLKRTDDETSQTGTRTQFQTLSEQKELFVQALRDQRKRQVFILPPGSNRPLALRTVTVPRPQVEPEDLEAIKEWLLVQYAEPVEDLAQQISHRQAAVTNPESASIPSAPSPQPTRGQPHLTLSDFFG